IDADACIADCLQQLEEGPDWRGGHAAASTLHGNGVARLTRCLRGREVKLISTQVPPELRQWGFVEAYYRAQPIKRIHEFKRIHLNGVFGIIWNKVFSAFNPDIEKFAGISAILVDRLDKMAVKPNFAVHSCN